MRTDIVFVSNEGNLTDAALDQAEKVAAYKELSPKNALHLRLLTEEMMGMMRSITGEAKGEFWIEDADDVYELHLRVRTMMDEEQREQLIAASTEKRNEATRGLMGKIRSFFEPAAASPVLHGLYMPGAVPVAENMTWCMGNYREQLEQYREEGRESAREAWDELEKSVVAHVADDIKVSIKGRVAEMTITKKMN